MTLIGQTTQTHGTTARYDGASGQSPDRDQYQLAIRQKWESGIQLKADGR